MATAVTSNTGQPTSALPNGTAEPETKTVNISLPEHVHSFFSRIAAEEDRTLSNFLKRLLVAHHKKATAPMSSTLESAE